MEYRNFFLAFILYVDMVIDNYEKYFELYFYFLNFFYYFKIYNITTCY